MTITAGNDQVDTDGAADRLRRLRQSSNRVGRQATRFKIRGHGSGDASECRGIALAAKALPMPERTEAAANQFMSHAGPQ